MVAKNAAGDESSYYSTELSAITPPSTGLNAEKRKKYEEWIAIGNGAMTSGNPDFSKGFSYYQAAANHYWKGQFWVGFTYYIGNTNNHRNAQDLIKAYAYFKAC